MKRVGSRGQILVGVILVLMILSILVPAMVLYTQRESTWTAKQAQTTSAFHLAESGVEKAYLKLAESTQTWRSLMDNGTAITDFKWDKAFTDVPGGRYAVSITSGPSSEKATVISVGQDSLRKESRALKVVYANSVLGGIAIFSGTGVNVGGGVTVHWGAIVSPNQITVPAGTTFPSIYSAAGIVNYDTDPNPPNCDSPDCCQWHAYYANIPPDPVIDLTYYASSAAASACAVPTGGTAATPAGSCYWNSAQSWSNGTVSGGQPVYVNGNLTLGSPGVDILGSLIVMGDLTTTSGNWGKGTRTPTLPTDAWKQYCKAWSTYQPFDSGEPASFPGVNSGYVAAANQTYNPSPNGKFAVSGLLYVQGNLNVGGGGGNTYVHGVMYVVGTTTMTSSSGVTLYYDKNAASAIQVTKIVLTRESWQDSLNRWPSTLP